MRCDEASQWLDAFADGELDPARTGPVQGHIAACAACRARLEDRAALRGALSDPALYRRAPGPLRAAITSHAAPDRQPAPRRTPAWAWVSLAACLLLAVGLLRLAAPFARGPLLEADAREAVSAHIRSLMASHLLDIATSDQHTVKPWFAGKVDFAPPVADFAAEGFPLAGGRLDYLADHPVAAIVYNRHAHVINIFVSPAAPGPAAEPRTIQDRGYRAIAWSDGAMRTIAVSDVSPDDLAALVRLLRSQGGLPTSPDH